MGARFFIVGEGSFVYMEEKTQMNPATLDLN